MRAYPTFHEGTQFRSRLEARWAVMFDELGWQWTYEPMDADGYIPDFLIHGVHPFFVEVGPCATPVEYVGKSLKADSARRSLRRDLLVVGLSPISLSPQPVGQTTAGWFGEWMGDPVEWVAEMGGDFPEEYAWGFGVWGKCYTCDAIGVTHEYQNFVLRPCGHHQSGSWGRAIPESQLGQKWRAAGNDTQWSAP